jgi:hypothetical protein
MTVSQPAKTRAQPFFTLTTLPALLRRLLERRPAPAVYELALGVVVEHEQPQCRTALPPA